MRDLGKTKWAGPEPDEPLAVFDPSKLGEELEEGDMRYDYLKDFDCKNADETKIVMVFDSGFIGFLNLKDNSFTAKKIEDVNWVNQDSCVKT